MPDNSVDSIVTDPPYGLSFMGKRWDYDVPSVEIWAECLRVLKPGGHLLAFAGTRTQHRMAVRIEDAGFEIRDMIAWVYGSGFPKSLNVSKAIDKGHGENRQRQLQFTEWMRSTGITAEQINEATGSCMASHYLTDKSQPAIATADMFDKLRPYLPEVPEYIERLVCERTGLEWPAYKRREVIGQSAHKSGIGNKVDGHYTVGGTLSQQVDITAPATDAAKQWHGWGTALKPALEPITVARKPLVGTVAENVIKWGTGAINVDGCRVEASGDKLGGGMVSKGRPKCSDGWDRPWMHDPQVTERKKLEAARKVAEAEALGRWPANLIHDGSDEVVGLFPVTTSGAMKRSVEAYEGPSVTGLLRGRSGPNNQHGDSGSAARFFYCAKASKSDRGESNRHPTVKPTDLMRYLCRLVTPPGGTVLDPFMGSGSTGKGAKLEGFNFIGIEREAEYIEIARARIEAVKPERKAPDLFEQNNQSK